MNYSDHSLVGSKNVSDLTWGLNDNPIDGIVCVKFVVTYVCLNTIIALIFLSSLVVVKIYEIILIWYIAKTITDVSYYILLKKKREYLIIHVLYSYFLVITSGGPIIWIVLIGHITKAVTNVLLFIWIALDDILKILGYIYLGGFKGSLIIFLRF